MKKDAVNIGDGVRKETSLKDLIFNVSICLLIFTLVLMMISSVHSAAYESRKKDYEDFSQGWLNDSYEEVNLGTIGGSCIIHKKIPFSENDRVLNFNARNVDVNVYIDDVCIYKTQRPDDRFLEKLYGKTAGSAFVEIPVLSEYSGKMMFIEIENPYKNVNACKIVEMFYGDGTQIVKHCSSVQLVSFCFAVIVIFLGFAFIAVYIPMASRKIVDRSMLYLGITAFLFGIVQITDNKLLHLIVGHETLFYTFSQLFMILITVPILLFFGKFYEKTNDRIIAILGIASIVDFVMLLILNMFGIMDYNENGLFSLLLLAGSIAYIAYLTVKDFIKKKNENKLHNIGVLLLFACIVLDFITSRMSFFVETSFFTKFGLAGFTCMECAQVLLKHMENYQKGLKAQLVSRLAYNDGLTDMLNRTSFIEDMDKLDEDKNDEILLAVFDVNNLKYVNDNFGHTHGDSLIINVANAMKRSFGGFGKCYRTGGDEFVFIAKCSEPEKKFNIAYEEMMQALEKLSEKSIYPVSVAVGFEVMSSKFGSIKELLDKADEKMYENKKEMKEKIVLPPVPQKSAG